MTHVTVYVAPDCIGCDRAIELVKAIHDCRIGEVIVDVVDTGASDVDLPVDLFAVPTWYLNGERFSLGNPSWDELARFLDPHAEGNGRNGEHDS